jgi:hypothetical protein
MTTTGRTELERRAIRCCLGGYESVSEELKQLKVRFGELLGHGNEDRESCPAYDNLMHQTMTPERNTDRESGTDDGSEGEAEQIDHSIEISEESRSPTQVSGTAIHEPTPGLFRRAGFGTWEETRPLVKGTQYGCL